MISVVIKDYLDSLHELALATDYGTFFGVVKATAVYGFHSLGLAIYYVLSFHWLRDFMELPVAFKHTYSLIFQSHGVIRGQHFLNFSLNHAAFSFLDTSPANRHSLFSGFLNSFFLSLPLSVVHILTLRAFLVNGTIAGLVSFCGSFCGQFLFYFCMLFGLESLLQPFFQLDGFVIGFGCFITVEILYRLTNFPDYTILSVMDRKPLLPFFRSSFLLAGLEQICVSNYFGNVSASPVYSILETTNSPHFFFITLFYLIGLMVGYVIWSLIFYFLVVQLRSLISEKLVNTSFFEISQKIHYGCVIGLLTMAMSSFFYYGYDFFITKSLGYVPEDEAMNWMAPTNKHYIQIEPFMEAEEIDDEEEEEDYIMDGVPFHAGDERAELSFELFGIPAENSEINKELSLERVEEKTGLFRGPSKIQFPYEEDPKYYKDEEPSYSVPDVDYRDSWYEATLSEHQLLFEPLIISAFRTDEYEAYRDRRSGTYLPETQVYRQFRDKYNTNILYRKLMKLNNVSFLSGQPKTSQLSPPDEFALYNRRFILQGYLDSVHRYKKMLQEPDDYYRSRRAKLPFADKVYNQQFKGSLSFIRKFNAVEITEYGNPDAEIEDFFLERKLLNPGEDAEKKVLKYDQPLYKKFKDEQLALLHEELPIKPKHLKLKPKRFLKTNDTRPLYIGWDNMLRKFMIKSAIVGPGIKSDIRDLGSDTPPKTKTVVTSIKKPAAWKRLLGIKNKPSFSLKGKVKGGICTKYEPVKKIPIKDKPSLPDYFQFQIWSPGTETVDATTKFKLPSLKATPIDVAKIKTSLELDMEEFDDYDYDPRDAKQKLEKDRMIQKISRTNQSLESAFRRLPIYDWYWALLEVPEIENFYAFRVGDATPPKIDGLAWPGQNPRYGLTCPSFVKEEDPQ